MKLAGALAIGNLLADETLRPTRIEAANRHPKARVADLVESYITYL